MNRKKRSAVIVVVSILLATGGAARADTVQDRINELNNKEVLLGFGARASAAEALGDLGDKRAVEPLIALLKNGDRYERSSAAKALAKLGDKRAVEPLIGCLMDHQYGVLHAAGEALAKLGDKRAVEPLIVCLKDQDRNLRWVATEALGNLGDERAVEPLIGCLKLMKDQELYVVFHTAEALGKLGKPAVGPLIACLRDQDQNVRLGAKKALGKLGKPAVEPMIACLKDQDQNVRSAAIAVLGKLEDVRAVDQLITCLKDEDKNTRRLAALALGKPGNTRAFEPLIACLKDQAWLVRMCAAMALGNLRDVRAVEPLIACLKDQVRTVRSDVAAALGYLGDVRAVEPLIGCLKDQDADVRWHAALALGRLGDARAIEPLTGCLKDSDVRKFAAEALAKLGKPRSQATDRLPKDRDNVCVGFPTLYTASGGIPPYTWRSSDPSKVTVDENTGVATGVGGGEVTITATDSSGNTKLNIMIANAATLAAAGAARAAEEEAPIDWPARAATVKVGMTRAEVEKVLPQWNPPPSYRVGFWAGGIGNGYVTTQQYLVSEDWRVVATYEASQKKGSALQDSQAILVAPIKVNKMIRSSGEKKEWMAKAASIKVGMTRAEAERNMPAWSTSSIWGLSESFESRELYSFSDSWADASGGKLTWSLAIHYNGTGGQSSLKNRVIWPVRIEELPQASQPGNTKQSWAQQLRVALQYHLNLDGGAPISDRLALAKAFSRLQEYEQRAVLGDDLWPRARCKEFRSVLEAMMRLPEKAEQDVSPTIADAIVGRLIELGFTAARDLLLKDIRSGYPRLAFKGLASLPEQPVPELDDAFRAHLNREGDLFKMSFVVGRYGSAALLDQVKALYSSSDGGWACTIQAALLRYLIKHDPAYGLAHLELALTYRGGPDKNNCFGNAIYETLHGLRGQEIQAFATKHLSAEDSQIRYSASKYLAETGAADARKK